MRGGAYADSRYRGICPIPRGGWVFCSLLNGNVLRISVISVIKAALDQGDRTVLRCASFSQLNTFHQNDSVPLVRCVDRILSLTVEAIHITGVIQNVSLAAFNVTYKEINVLCIERFIGDLNTNSCVSSGSAGDGVGIAGEIDRKLSTNSKAVAAGAHAGKLVGAIAAITGGKGGGRPDNAMAGGKDAAKVDEALASAASLLKDQLNA